MINFIKNNMVFGTPKTIDKPFVYSINSDGIYLHKKVMGQGIVSVKVDKIPGLEAGKETIKALPRKIPINVLWTIIKFFRKVNQKNNSKDEAYAIIGYSYNENKFCIYIPEQTVSGGSVKYDAEKFYKDNEGYIIVMDIHTHYSMGAFWSSTDNKDDQRDRFSGVLGHVEKVIPDMKFRFSTLGKHFEFNVEDLFEENDETFDIDFESNYLKIKQVIINTIQKITNVKDSNNFFGFFNGNTSYIDTYIQRSKARDFSIKELMGEDW